MQSDIIYECIRGKDVFIFEDHHQALLPWAHFKQKIGIAPVLLSFDYHTDTRMAFTNHAYNVNKNFNEMEKISKERCSIINPYDFETIKSAIKDLRHDEHIDAGIRSGIIDCAYIIQNQAFATLSMEDEQYFENLKRPEFFLSKPQRPSQPMTYAIPENRMFIASDGYTFDQHECKNGDAALIRHRDRAIEDAHISIKLGELRQMSHTSGLPWIESNSYILDIDLDYFNTWKSINPDACSNFYQLIRNSSGITIARESDCVDMLKIEGEQITSDMLLSRMRQHIDTALCY